MGDMGDNLNAVVDRLLAEMAETWGRGDAKAWAALFAGDVEFVDVLGRVNHGRDGVEDVQRRNFATIHQGSTITPERLSVRELADGVALAHVRGTMRNPAGPLAGETVSTQTLVLTRREGGWRVQAFHNTVVQDTPWVPALR